MKTVLSTSKNVPLQKYLDHRGEIKNGDVILYRGNSLMSKAIHYVDNAYYNHAGVVWIPENSDRVLTLDMWSGGLTCLPLSRRMSGYTDFCIVRPKTTDAIINEAVKTALGLWDGRDIKYDYAILFRIALIKKTGIDITGLGSKKEFICSQFAQYYINLLGIHTYDSVELITPQDFIRFVDENIEIILLK